MHDLQKSNQNGFWMSTDKRYLDLDTIYRYLNEEAYWSKGIAKELVIVSIENSTICYGIFKGNPGEGKAEQVGFARVVSDLVRTSWVGDVFILPEYRGLGLSKWLIGEITEHPKLKGTGFNLTTRDAHTLYSQFGFKPLEQPEMRMYRPHNWDDMKKAYNISK